MRRLRGSERRCDRKDGSGNAGPARRLMPSFRHFSQSLRRIFPPHHLMGCAMRSQRIALLVEIALCAALSAVLSMLAVRLPINIAGGSVSFAMVPIFALALRRGLVPGVIAGALFGFTDLLIEPYFVAPIQVALDYPIAYAALGLAGLGAPLYRRARTKSAAAASATALAFMVLGGLGRFAAAWTSGVVFFGANAPAGQPVWLYSLGYNATYIVPSMIICAAAAIVILPVLEHAVPSAPRSERIAS